MTEVISGVGMFTGVVLALVAVILVARSRLVPSGNVRILINDDESKALSVPAGGKLLNVLADNKVFVSSACGGGGTCAQCKVNIYEGGGDILSTETSHITKNEAREGVRLSCQVNVKQDMKIEVPPEVFSVKKWECEVVSNDNVATFIKEFVVKLPEGETLDFQPGGFIQIEVPPFECDFKDFEGIDERFHPDWDRFNVWDFKLVNTEPVFRAYSMANHPAEGDIIMLNIRIATPPPDREKGGWDGCTTGHRLFLCVQPQAGRQGDESRGLSANSSSRKPTAKWSISAVAQAWRLCVRIYTISSTRSRRGARCPIGTGRAIPMRSSTRITSAK